MDTGANLKDDGLSIFRNFVFPSQNCRIGSSYVSGYPSRKFRLPFYLRVHLAHPESFGLVLISGRVAVFLMNLDTRLAATWVAHVDARRLNTPTQDLDVETRDEKDSCCNGLDYTYWA